MKINLKLATLLVFGFTGALSLSAFAVVDGDDIKKPKPIETWSNAPTLQKKCAAAYIQAKKDYGRSNYANYLDWQKELKRRKEVAVVLADITRSMRRMIKNYHDLAQIQTPGSEGESELQELKDWVDREWAYVKYAGWHPLSNSTDGLQVEEVLNSYKFRFNELADTLAYPRNLLNGNPNSQPNYEELWGEEFKTVRSSFVVETGAGTGLAVCYFDKYAKRVFKLPKRNCVIIDLTSNSDTEKMEAFRSSVSEANGANTHLVFSAASDMPVTPSLILEQMLAGSEFHVFPNSDPTDCDSVPSSQDGYTSCALPKECGDIFTVSDSHEDSWRDHFLADLGIEYFKLKVQHAIPKSDPTSFLDKSVSDIESLNDANGEQ